MRKLIALTVVLIVGILASASVVLGDSGTTVSTTGEQNFVPNSMMVTTLKFSPGQITVRSGDTVTWVDLDREEEPHTITVVAPADVPRTMEQATFFCYLPGGSCFAAIIGHCGMPGFCTTGNPTMVLEGPGTQPGLDGPGDSVLMLHGGSVKAKITASPGATLSYICGFHPWMQGTIKVQ